ncbi:FAD-binding and (Fe-S)-binding domain-containing protein [Arthrobacter sp. B2a2-09]|uniref:FAD-binding and (Fe-S)-binding domain-containing protein n=1 Tax=Arthrobacter sp. B2a2-09 TaxID=2952822 RepID=UPI0022CD2BAC|nr:FAD-binding and (Fe-S)-binding domain-containing protein [Arthrobacter sp. B2a2-09]MCZ9883617.1 FAD-binding oxidoreductase [Arthrobacter sp. B2a2-09]
MNELRGFAGFTTRDLDRLAMAHDASHYLLKPRAVVAPVDAAEVGRIMASAASVGTPLVFRSGGTSLSGQAVTDGLLVDVRKHFRSVDVLDDGARVRVGPGATVRSVNARLSAYGRKLGPDPASEGACTIGGVVANNSSGMACGTEFNTYRTLESLVMVLPSGTVIDTANPDADKQLHEQEPGLHEGLLRLRRRIISNPDSVRTIDRMFAMKNTMGYGLNSFLDFEEPVKILEHLMIGSEGTLGFIAQATFHTIESHPYAATGLMTFNSLNGAASALPELVACGLATVELMDAASLAVAQRQAGTPASLAGLEIHRHAALLVEHQAPSAEELLEKQQRSQALFDSLDLAAPFELSTDAKKRSALWHIRKGLYTTVAGSRPAGTNALLEDIAVPVPALAETCEQLLGLFDRHHYQDSVIFGHAKDGNIHFMLTERFDDPSQLDRYEAFTEDMVDLVLGNQGTLKAEHGTGRIMAPFVARQYGPELYDVMCTIKRLADPQRLLNPGVVLSEEPRSYLDHLKTAPVVEEEVDRCVECGYCEPVCPSKDLTMTPRQRIAIRREIAAAEQEGNHPLAERLRKDYEYDGVQTCAADGMCQGACPVLINTGDLVRRLRAENHNAVADKGWTAAARHWGAVTAVGSLGLSAAKAMPAAAVQAVTAAGRVLLGAENVPLYSDALPRGGRKRTAAQGIGAGESTGTTADAVYFPACIGAMFGPADDGRGNVGTGVTQAFLNLAGRAGVELIVPRDIGNLCCGTPWKSKGFIDGYDVMRDRVLPALWEASDHGRLPVICDASSCTEGLEALRDAASSPDALAEYSDLKFIDSVQFAKERLMPHLDVSRRLESLALHPTCSSTRLGINGDFTAIAASLADNVVVPPSWGCCAYAGDRGLLHPELTDSATAAQAAEVNELRRSAYASTNRTCELGMTRATGHEYRHILELLDEATSPRKGTP